MVCGNAVAVDGGEISLSLQINGGEASLSLQIDGGEIELYNLIDGGEQGVFFPVYPDLYTGVLDVIPSATEEQTLECAHKSMPDNVTVTKVPYFETSNDSGTTVYIASRGDIYG